MGCQGSHVVTPVEVAHTTVQSDASSSHGDTRLQRSPRKAAKASCTKEQKPKPLVAEPEPQLVRATFCKTNNELLGVRCMVRPHTQEAVITEILPVGVIAKWNEENPDTALRSGDVIVDVNSKTSIQDMMNELAVDGSIVVVIRRAWDKAPNPEQVLKKACLGCAQTPRFFTLPKIVRAADIDFIGDSCAICLESVGPDDSLVKLDCGHGFHVGCLTEYLMQGKRRVCPLCIRELQ